MIKNNIACLKKDAFLSLTLILAAFLFFTSLLTANKLYLWDEAVYLSTAENLLNTNPYYTEIDYRPPLLPVLIGIGSFFMDIDAVSHIIASGFLFLGIVGMYFLGKIVFNRKTGFVSSVLFGISPFLMHISSQIMTDVPVLTLLVWSAFFVYKFLDSRKENYIIVSGILMALSVLMKFTAIIIIPIILVMLHKNRKSGTNLTKKYLLTILIALLPYLFWAQITQGFALLPFIKAQVIVAGSEQIPDIFYYLKALYPVGGLIGLVGLLFYLFRFKSVGKKGFVEKEMFFVLWVLFVLVYLSTNPHKELRYLTLLLPPVFLLGSAGFLQLSQSKNICIKTSILAIFILAIIFPYHNITYFNGSMDLGEEILLNRTAEIMAVSTYIRGNMPDNLIIYSHSSYPLISYYTKRKALSTWPWDSGFYSKFPGNMKNNGWYVHYKDIKKEPNQAWLDSNKSFRKIKEFGNIVIYEYAVQKTG